MTRIEFQKKLKDLKLNIKEFSTLSKVPVTTAYGWTDESLPEWVESWLDNYKTIKDYQEKEKQMKEKKLKSNNLTNAYDLEYYKNIEEKAKKYDKLKKIVNRLFD